METGEAFYGFLKIAGGLFLFFLCARFVWKNNVKAAVSTTLCGVIFLFFGDIKYTIGQLPVLHHLAHYKVFVPLLLVSFLLFIIALRKRKQFTGITVFLNVLFALYFLLDVVTLLTRKQTATGITATQLKEVNIPTGSKPNIYYILLDCYPSKGYQAEMLGVVNSYLDSSLSTKGFYVVNESRSNYSNTAFSIASTLGLNYLTNIDTSSKMAAYHYNRAMRIVKKSPFISTIQQQGYRVFNYSIFDIAGYPALRKDLFLSAGTSELLFYNTLWGCVKRDLVWQLLSNKKKTAAENITRQKKFFLPQKEYNKRLLDTLGSFRHTRQPPFFLYAHLEMPHFPYFFDENGNPYPDELVYGDSMITDRRRFAGYIGYTNAKADEIVSRILKESGGKAIIIVQSDHSIADMDWSKKDDAFRNFSAFYFPDGDYRKLYAGISNVNTFRVILNKYFGQQLPLLPDKSYYIK